MRAKHVFREVECRSVDGAETHLSMHQKLGLVPSASTGEKRLVSESYAGGKIVEPDDLVLNRLKAHLGVFAYASLQGVISPDYTVLRPLPNAVVRYYEYLLKSPACRGELRTRIKGIVEGFWRLYTDDFYDIRLPVPPLDEQRLIVRFLDWHGEMTGKLIRAKRSVLALIAEQREVLTREALEHSETRLVRFGRVAESVLREVDRTSAPQFTTIGLFNRGRGIFRKPALAGDELGQSTFNWVHEGDLIFSGQFAWEGAVAVAGTHEHGCIASHRYHLVQGDERQASNVYLWCLFRSSLGHLLLNEHSRGAAGRNRPLNINTLMKEDIPIANEGYQEQLREFVEQERRIAQEIADEITLILEFRTRLIADVVTGQLDVRAVAANLPELTEDVAEADVSGDDDLDADADDMIDAEEAA